MQILRDIGKIYLILILKQGTMFIWINFDLKNEPE